MQFGQESKVVGIQAVSIIIHPLDKVFFGRLGHHLLARGQRIFLGPEAGVWRIHFFDSSAILVVAILDRLKAVNAEFSSVVIFGELVTVGQQHFSAEYVHHSAYHQITVFVVVYCDCPGL